MATAAAALLQILAKANLTATSPHEGDVREDLENTTGGRRWTDGNASGQVNRVYRKTGSLGAGATDSYNTLAAGALTDVYGQTIDLDELKGLVIVPLTGSIRLEAPAANFIGIFNDATDLLNVPAGGLAFDFGAAGLDVTVNSKFDITETTGAATATYELWFIGAT